MLHADNGDIENLNTAITLVEKFLTGEALETMDILKNSSKIREVEDYYIPLMQKNLILWKKMADYHLG